MLKRIHKLVIFPFSISLFVGFAVAMFAFTMQFMWHYTDNLVGKGLGFAVIAEVMMHTSINISLMALPLAILIATVMTFGNMGQNYELTALKSSGISLTKTMRSLLVLMIFLTIAMYFFANNVVPQSQYKFRNLIHSINKKNPEINFIPGVFNNDIPGFTIRADDINQESGMMYGFLLYDHTEENGNTNVILSDSATMVFTSDERNMILDLYNGRGYNELPDSTGKFDRQQRNVFEKQQIIYKVKGNSLTFVDVEMKRKNFRTLNQKQLTRVADSLYNDYLDRENRYFANIIALKNPAAAKTAEQKAKALNETEKELLLQPTGEKKIDEQILKTKRNLRAYMADYKRYIISWHKKLVIPIGCILFFIIGVPFGAIIRKGGVAVSIAVSMFLFIVYYMLSNFGEKLVRENRINEIIGIWSPTIIMLLLGIVLLYKANKDAIYINVDNYWSLIKRKFKRK